MAELFAAIDAEGEMRFVDEVARGAACGCRCPECLRPLVAKQGDSKAWHFAHEGRQEHPECAVGASNLLRRFSIEVLKSIEPPLELPSFLHRLTVKRGGGVWTTDVELNSARSMPWLWTDSPPRGSAVARSRFADGADVELHVDVSPPFALTNDAKAAVVSFALNLPMLEVLQSREKTRKFILNRGEWRWLCRPDPGGEITAASDALVREANDTATAEQAEARRASEEADAELAKIARVKAEMERARAAHREITPWQEPAFDLHDPPYVFREQDKSFRRAAPAAPESHQKQIEAHTAVDDLIRRDPRFARFPVRWVARAIIKAQADWIARGANPDAPATQESIEADALALLVYHYRR